jgi:lipoprotein-anchoring transpeptidase ErfK/SrfK
VNNVNKLFVFCTYIFLLLVSHDALSTEYDLPEKGFRLIGENQKHKVKKGDYFQKIAEQYDVGFLALMAANPEADPFLPDLDSDIIIPSAMLLPYIKREGIVINLPELRLYYFLPEENKVHVFPVGIGIEGLETPKATSYISSKREDPPWRPTDATRQRYFEQHGKEMAKEIPAGPNNPFGKYALRLGTSEYLIHGSNKRFGIGMRASSGCIRMFDDDIKWLFDNIPLNTKVRIIEQPIKMSYGHDGRRLIEVHSPLTTNNAAQKNIITASVKHFVGKGKGDEEWKQLTSMFDKPQGLIVDLGQ